MKHPNQTLTASMLVLMIGLVGCGTDAAEPEPTASTTVEEATSTPETADTTEASPETEAELPGDYGEIIASEDECGALQDIFDTAENAAEGQRDSGNTDGARSFTAVMNAADDRMREVGCYD